MTDIQIDIFIDRLAKEIISTSRNVAVTLLGI